MSRKAWTLPSEKLWLRSKNRLLRFLNERSVNDGGDFCLLWLVILKSALNSVGDTF